MGNFEQAKLDLEKAISYEPTNKELFDKLEEVKKRSQNPVFSLPDSVNLETFDEDGVIPRFHYKDPNIYKYILNEVSLKSKKKKKTQIFFSKTKKKKVTCNFNWISFS